MRKLAEIVRHPSPVIMPATATVKDACCAMRDRSVGSVLVVEADGGLIGIFTGRDAVHRVLAEGKSAARTRLHQVMTPAPRTIAADRPAIEALRLMEDVGCRHLPIVREGRLVGVISRYDFNGVEIDRLDEEIGLWEHL